MINRALVWCAVSNLGVIGPYFFEGNGVTVTVNLEHYIEVLNTYFIPELQRRGVDLQQDGASLYTARASIAVLRPLFHNRLISRFGDVFWPPRSHDLTTCDFFL